MKMDIQLTKDGWYRPETLMINGELASMALFLEKHGYNWKATASGNVLFYRTESGKEYQVAQASLRDIGKKPFDNKVYQNEYHKAMKTKLVSFNPANPDDMKLYDHIMSKENATGYIKQLIREDMDKLTPV